MNNLQAYYSGRTQSQSSYDGPQEQEPERRATGPIPKVCRLRNLGGGGYDFGSSFGAATLPRHGGGRRLSVIILAFVPKVSFINYMRLVAYFTLTFSSQLTPVIL